MCTADVSDATKEIVSGVLASPSIALETYPQGGTEMTRFVSLLLTSDSRTLPALISTVGQANTAQKQAIGLGFAYAMRLCNVQPDYAQKLAEAVIATSDSTLIAWLGVGLPETATAALGIGAATGGGTGDNGGGVGSGASAPSADLGTQAGSTPIRSQTFRPASFSTSTVNSASSVSPSNP
ncbi:MAG: hypothetical protein KDJ77_14545 [Rhodobiaceae bacterium]|nr:hypothetical protein [Rhodobiaceae bacterium]